MSVRRPGCATPSRPPNRGWGEEPGAVKYWRVVILWIVVLVALFAFQQIFS